MIDIHNHILPGLDDGAKTIEDALLLLHLAVEDSVTHLVCTPHIHPGRYNNTLSVISKAFGEFCRLPEVKRLPIKLAMAAEVRLSDEILLLHRQNQLPYIGEWRGSKVLLLELPHDRLPMGLISLMNWMKQQGITPLIAHPERNRELMRRPEMAIQLSEQGALFQATAASTTGQFGDNAKTLSHWLLERNLVDFVASDAHHPVNRPSSMMNAYEVLSTTYGHSVAETLCRENPALLTHTLFNG
ncbi:capsular biosynthesis protein [Endozoicomonas gorgoniicola]|uniref:protein-tyrosine-phosphatase n=1 Tax=Endozoicomonas gorgoniicola TaxID=1234144 RepID=A0ABT3MPS1_9GAMM|nr:CpsB/CapC family capsule biosynthesis tyrosine phosphatase [Endozoicomonas gorgoniicola]MCW7551373.1 capsular biosynthesis protein [Endozoicomonas gorgoniicola]